MKYTDQLAEETIQEIDASDIYDLYAMAEKFRTSDDYSDDDADTIAHPDELEPEDTKKGRRANKR